MVWFVRYVRMNVLLAPMRNVCIGPTVVHYIIHHADSANENAAALR